MEGDPSGFFDGAENAAFSFPSVNSCEIGRCSGGKLTTWTEKINFLVLFFRFVSVFVEGFAWHLWGRVV